MTGSGRKERVRKKKKKKKKKRFASLLPSKAMQHKEHPERRGKLSQSNPVAKKENIRNEWARAWRQWWGSNGKLLWRMDICPVKQELPHLKRHRNQHQYTSTLSDYLATHHTQSYQLSVWSLWRTPTKFSSSFQVVLIGLFIQQD